MKNLLISAALSALLLASCAKQSATPQPEAAKASATQTQTADVQTASIAVPTVKCGMCVKTIKTAFTDAPGVTEVNVDKKAHIATIAYNPSKTNVAAIEKQIAEAGYDANSTKRDAKAYEALHDCCK